MAVRRMSQRDLKNKSRVADFNAKSLRAGLRAAGKGGAGERAGSKIKSRG